MRRLAPTAMLALALAVAMFFAVRARLFDGLAVGDQHGRFALDYFCLPRAWLGLRDGRGAFATQAIAYGPYASNYLSHPLAAVALGGPLAALPPWTGYWAFLVLSLATLAGFALLAGGALAPFALLASVPTYLMLWNGQLHVALVAAVVLLLAGVLRERPRLVLAGLLLSLLTKPALLLCAAPLSAARLHRRALVAALTIWAFASLLFLLPPLDPARDNATHFLAIARAWSRLGSEQPEWREYFSLPAMVRHYAGRVSPLWFQAPLVVLLFASARSNGHRAFELCLMALLCPFLAYPVVWEYHYAPLAATAPFLLERWRAAPVDERTTLGVALACASTMLLPTPYALWGGDIETHYLIVRAFRVGPALVMFLTLASLVARRQRSV